MSKPQSKPTYLAEQVTMRKPSVSKHIEMPEITFNIQPGPVSPAQKAAWRKFWARLISEAKGEQ